MSNAMSTLAFIKSMSAGGGGGEAESHMFLATYGTTTAAEVGAAYHANKVCYVLNSNEENLGVIVEENNTHYTFGCPKAKGTLLMSVNKTTNAWSTNFYSHYAVGGNGISVVHGEGTGATGNEETISAKVDGTTIGFDADGKLKTIGSSSDDTFIAIHGETTIEQLDAAYAAGKNIICKGFYEDSKKKKPGNDEYSYLYMNLDWATSYNNNTYYEFTCTDCYGYIYTTYRLSSEEQWGDIKCIEPGGDSNYTAGPGIDISDDEDKEISVKVDGTTISFNNQDELVVVGGGGSSEEVIIEGEEYFDKATQHEKHNGNMVIGYYNYNEGGYTEYDFTYQMMHVTDFSGSITDGLITLGHYQMWNNYRITMTGTIVSDLTISIDTKRKLVYAEADGCYEITWSGKDASGKIIGNSVCICGYNGDDNMISDIKVSADGVNFTDATVKGTIKASK